jgi:hypothetical protein
MKNIKSILAVTLVSALMAAPAFAANISAKSASTIGAQVTSAYLTTTQVERQMSDSIGEDLSSALINGLDAIDRSAVDALKLSNNDEHLQPGLEHVRDVVSRVKQGNKVTEAAIGLVGEASIELYALMVNAAILEAEAHLESANKALSKGKKQDVVFSLEQASVAMERANERGAYHLQNDLEEIEAALSEISDKVSANVPVSKEAIDERIEEINSHLFHVGNE